MKLSIMFFLVFNCTVFSQNYLSKPYKASPPVSWTEEIKYANEKADEIQNRFDMNFTRIMNCHKNNLDKIYTVAKIKEKSQESYNKALEYYNLFYYQKYVNGKYNISHNKVTEAIIYNIEIGRNEALCIFFEYCD